MRDHIIQVLFGSDPYTDWPNWSGKTADHSYPHTNVTPDVIGRMLDDIHPSVPKELAIEVGSFKGGSAIRFIREFRNRGLSLPLMCIDTFLGDANMRMNVGDMRPWLGLRGGHPTVYDQFMANVIDAGMEKDIIPLVASSTVGLKIAIRSAYIPCLIYLDSAHEPDETYHELNLCYQCVAPGGVIGGDDLHWEGVNRDVWRFVNERQLNLIQAGQSQWWFVKPYVEA